MGISCVHYGLSSGGTAVCVSHRILVISQILKVGAVNTAHRRGLLAHHVIVRINNETLVIEDLTVNAPVAANSNVCSELRLKFNGRREQESPVFDALENAAGNDLKRALVGAIAVDCCPEPSKGTSRNEL
ncbi:MAG: PDZ domain-containing protein, partial [Coriobacteriia bacterium]|nr:PDZ domain-containing protein [Coriobacteriia bacterium]